jgi:hypothetical protein
MMVELAVAVTALAAGTATAAQVAVVVGAAASFSAVVAPVMASVIAGFVVSLIAGGSSDKGGAGASPSTLLKQPIPMGQVVFGTTRTGGSLAVFHHGETPGETGDLHMLAVIACHEIDGVAALYDGDRVLWTEAGGIAADYAGRISAVVIGKGSDVQAPLVDMVADLPETMAGAMGENFALRGHAYVYLKLPNVKRNWASGLPQVWCEVRGALVLDPRTGLRAWSANWALCVAHYLTLDRGGCGFDMAADVVSSALVAAANMCDERVPLSAGGDCARYEINGTIATNLVPRSVLQSLMLQGAGSVIDSGGRFVVRPGGHVAPVAVIGAADMRSVAEITRAVDVESLPDGVSGTFTSPAAGFQPDAFGSLMFSDYLPEDGAARMLSLELLRETLPERAQRLALLGARMARRSVALSVEVSPDFAMIEAGDVVTVDLPEAGIEAAQFEVLAATWLHNSAAGSVSVGLSMVETSADLWAWTVADAVGVVSPAASLFASARVIAAPQSVTVSPVVRFAADGAAVPGLLVAWDPSLDPYLAGYQVTATPAGGVARLVPVGAGASSVVVEGLAEGVAVAVEVAALNIFGLSSAGGADPGGDVSPIGDTSPPSPPADLSAVGGVDRVALSWTLPPESDFAAVMVREAVENDFAASALVWRGNAASCERSGLAINDPRWWWFASIDRTGNVSAWVGPVSAALAGVTAEQIPDDSISTDKLIDGAAVDYGAAYGAGAVGVSGGSVWTVVQSVRVWRDAPGALAIWCGCGFQGGAPNSGEGDVPTPVYFRVLVDGVEVAALSLTGEGISGRFDGHTVLESAAAGGLSTVTMQLKGISSLEGVARTLTAIMLKRTALPVLPPV